MNFHLSLEMLAEWYLGIYALMQRGIDVVIWIYVFLLEIVLGERMRNEMKGFPQFQRRGHGGSFPPGASRGMLVSGVVRM
jgi:hypothetical protein